MDISNKLTNIEERLATIEAILNEIKEQLKPVEKSCNKMQTHISFVENTYTAIRGQLGYFVDVPKINDVP
jgi:uncharacterized coiled-coil protein SlyX